MYSRLRQVVNTTLYHFDTSIKSRISVSTPSYVATRLPHVAAHPIRSFGSIRMVRPAIISSVSKNIMTGSLSRHHDESYKFPIILKRYMGGGERNEEHKERMRAIRKARKIYFASLPPSPPKPPVCPKNYRKMCKLKTEPISARVEHRLVHICNFIIYAWLNAYPFGASLRKLQRDIAFRMQRRYRLPEKLPLEEIMPIVGKLERENYLKTRMKVNGQVVIYRDYEENIVPENEYNMREAARTDDEAELNGAVSLHDVDEEKWFEDDEEWFNDETVGDKKIENNSSPNYAPYEPLTYRPKFVKEHKPKEAKVKTRKLRDQSDPVMEWVEIPEGTIYSSRGPRYISSEKTDE